MNPAATGTPLQLRWNGEFQDAGLEQAFQADAWPRLSQHLRRIALLAGGLYLAALYLNWMGFGNGLAFQSMATLRICTGLLFGGIALASRPEGSQKRVHSLFLLTILSMVATRLLENHLLAGRPSAGPPMQVIILPVLPLVAFAILAIPLRLVLVWSGVGSLLFLRDQVLAWGLEAHVTQVVLLYLLLANGVGIAFRVAWNRITRRDFALRNELEQEVAERQRAETEAHRANAAKGRFLAVLSHEIRTPLNGVLGGVQLLQETPLSRSQTQPLELVAHSGNQLAMLLDDVLDLARIEAGRLDLVAEPFSPANLLAGAHAVLYTQARAKGLALRLEHPTAMPSALVGDELRLRQVLINLAGNAVKFTAQGEVRLSLAIGTSAERADHLRCTFTVRDTGPGLELAAQARIFNPFEQGDATTRRSHGGAGLGLAISRELVLAMGGELRLESAPGQGSTFSFTLDLPLGQMRTAAGSQIVSARPLAILVVDDLEANRIVLQGLLANLGHRTRTTATGAEALAALRSDSFDAILLDLHLPDMDGLEVLRRIRSLSDQRSANLPVFLATAETERNCIQACLAAGMQGVLSKPIRKARLAALLAGVTMPNENSGVTAEIQPAEVPMVDTRRVTQLFEELGPDTWQAGTLACRESARVCLEELEDQDPIRSRKALHRLAGLAASYGLPRLHQAVRRAEILVAAGSPCLLDDLRSVAGTSLTHLEATPQEQGPLPAQVGVACGPEF